MHGEDVDCVTLLKLQVKSCVQRVKDNKAFDTETTPSLFASNHEVFQDMTNPQSQKFTFFAQQCNGNRLRCQAPLQHCYMSHPSSDPFDKMFCWTLTADMANLPKAEGCPSDMIPLNRVVGPLVPTSIPLTIPRMFFFRICRGTCCLILNKRWRLHDTEHKVSFMT